MKQRDFLKLIGADKSESDFLPVACLLQSGYGCVGYYHQALNEGLDDTCVLVNARLVDLPGEEVQGTKFTIHDFNDFLEEIVANFQTGKQDPLVPKRDEFGKSIPLNAIPLQQIAILYPVSHIGALLERLVSKSEETPSFLDFANSEIVQLLRMKLW
jgi:hypothetical protein